MLNCLFCKAQFRNEQSLMIILEMTLMMKGVGKIMTTKGSEQWKPSLLGRFNDLFTHVRCVKGQ